MPWLRQVVIGNQVGINNAFFCQLVKYFKVEELLISYHNYRFLTCCFLWMAQQNLKQIRCLNIELLIRIIEEKVCSLIFPDHLTHDHYHMTHHGNRCDVIHKFSLLSWSYVKFTKFRFLTRCTLELNTKTLGGYYFSFSGLKRERNTKYLSLERASAAKSIKVFTIV